MEKSRNNKNHIKDDFKYLVGDLGLSYNEAYESLITTYDEKSVNEVYKEKGLIK